MRKLRFIFVLFFLVGHHSHSQTKSKLIAYDQSEIVLQNARIVDVVKGIVLDGQSILISSGKIKAIGKTGKLQVPKAAQIIDLKGKTILPGLVMLHEHMNYNNGAAVWQFHPVSFPKLYLAAGITTLRTAGAENPMYDLNLKRKIDSGESIGPRMFVTGPMFNDASGGFLGDFVISNYDQGKKATAFWADQGCTSFKVYSDIGTDALKGVLDEAHSRNLPVTGHLGKMSCTEAANLGIDNIEHSFWSCASDLSIPWEGDWKLNVEQKGVNELIELLVAKKIVLTITPFSDSDYRNPALLEYLSTDERKRVEGYLKNPPPFMPKGSNDSQLRPFEKLFVQKGGKVVLGADAADCGLLPGFQNHNEMVTLVKAGWTPLDVIKIATIDGAKFLKIDNESGSIEVGKSADLLIVSGKPDENIEDIKNVELVFKNGVGYDSKVLRERAKGLVGRH
ncbi:amidohydrolase family protein [Flavobacterium sp.]|uniref:amidohydrolase family protein n=1 Tax=Flavobacterium sp. TaxID=239 RepID=UPI0025B9A480|nr:amidohydrolase family protein [Flavobacterium sp.]